MVAWCSPDGDSYLEVAITYGEGDDDRELELRCIGGRWSARERLLAEHLDDWVVR